MKLDREILRLSGPAVISNITVPLLALSDTTIAGHLRDVVFLAAIAMGSMMFNTVFWLFGFLRMGTTGLTAQAYGLSDKTAISRTFSQAFLIAMTAGILIVIFRHPLLSLLLDIMDAERETASLAAEYFSITVLSAPALLGTMAINGWLFGMQTTLLPMIISITVNIINIGLSIFLVFGTDAGFSGIAWGTFGANWAGLFIALFVAFRFKGKSYLISSFSEILKFNTLKRFFKVNGDIFLRSGCIMAVSVSVTAFGARLGSLTLATNTVMMQFFIFFSYFMDGLAFTAEALCGRFAGMGDRNMLYTSIRRIGLWGVSTMLVFLIIYIFGHNLIVGLITDNIAVREEIHKYAVWLILIPPLTVCAFIFDGVYIGLTATGKMLLATLLGALIFFTISLVHFSPLRFGFPDNYMVWTAFLAYLTMRGIVLAVLTPQTIRRFFLSSEISSIK